MLPMYRDVQEMNCLYPMQPISVIPQVRKCVHGSQTGLRYVLIGAWGCLLMALAEMPA
jgi:hypothetical protein